MSCYIRLLNNTLHGYTREYIMIFINFNVLQTNSIDENATKIQLPGFNTDDNISRVQRGNTMDLRSRMWWTQFMLICNEMESQPFAGSKWIVW